MAQATSANLTCSREGCKCHAPCAQCIKIRAVATQFASFALGEPGVTFGANITKAVNDAVVAETTWRIELDSAIASNVLSTKEADAKQREIARKEAFSADDAAQLEHLKNLQGSYAVINEGLKKKAALADTEAHEALLSLVLRLLRAQSAPEPVTYSAPAAPEPVTDEAMQRAATEKREQEAAERAKEAKRHALIQAEVQKAAQYAKAKAAQRAAEVTNALSVANSLVEDELKKKGLLDVGAISTAKLFEAAWRSPRTSGRRRWRMERNCPRHWPRVRLLWTSLLVIP